MRILYVTTTFPVFSETFLQREARALLKAGVEMRIISLHRGESTFDGHPVERFSKWSLLKLLYLLPLLSFRYAGPLAELARVLNSRRPASAINLFENLLGFGAALVQIGRVRAFRPDLIHCVWASAPAAYGMVLSQVTGIPFSTGAHAYDIFEYGGDWLLPEKARRAAFAHVSTDVAAERIRRLCDPRKVKRIRRGLNQLPRFKPLRRERSCLRIVCVARLVEKKGFPCQVAIYRRLRELGMEFEARIVGEGPLERSIREDIEQSGLSAQVRLLGRVSEQEALEQLQWADALFHTGVVAASGDRDGLPNVVPEAMASGVIVLGSPVSGVVEAVSHLETGFLCDPRRPAEWAACCQRLREDDVLCSQILKNARKWVEREFVADRNTAELIRCMRESRELGGFLAADLRVPWFASI